MRVVRYISALAFFISIPFVVVAFGQDVRYPVPLSGMFAFAALAAFAINELYLSPAPAGDRIKRLSYQVMLFVCNAILVYGAYQMIVGNTVTAG